MKEDIFGSGGGKGGRQPVEAPNTLQSRSTIKLVEVLSEGPIGGVVGELKGVFFDETPVRNADDSYNFPAVKFDQRFGLWDGYDPAEPAQTHIPGFSDGTESPIAVATEITVSGVTRNVSTNVDAARVIVRLPQGLYKGEDSGDLNGYRVGIRIETRLTAGGTWTIAKEKTITGKTLTAYEEAYRIERPDAGGTAEWQIRITRTTTPSVSIKAVDRIDWQAYSELRDIKVTYDGAAVVGVALDAESTGGRVPRRSYLVDGRQVKVPHNYTPRTYHTNGTVNTQAVYTGTFNGTMVDSTASCDNPAWVLYDLLTNDRYGMGEVIDPSQIDIYSFYDAAVYCDELVDDGLDGSTNEPRFRFNGVLQTREEAFKTIQAVAASMRAFVFVANGLVKIIQDRPQDTVAVITNANVVDGKFSYSNSELAARATAATVVFNDRLDNYNPRTIIEEANSTAIARYGYNKIELAAYGVVDEAQARRMAKWAIDGSFREDIIATFSVSWQNAFVEVGDVVSVSDNFIANYQLGGKIVGGDTDSITLDRAVTLSGPSNIRYMRWDGTEAIRIITNPPGTYTTLDLSPGENVGVYVGSAWGLYGTAIPRLFKILSVKEASLGVYELSAVSYDPASYDRIESGIIVDPPDFGVPGGGSLPAPTGLTINRESLVDVNGNAIYNLRIDWNDVVDPNFRNYRVRWRKDNNQFQWSGDVLQSEFIIDNALPGVYEVSVYAYNARGAQSPGVEGWYRLAVGTTVSSLPQPTNLRLKTGGTSFNGLAFTFVWDAPAPSPSVEFVLKDYQVKLYNGATLIQTIDTDVREVSVTREQVVAWAGSPIRTISVEVRARDSVLNLTNAVSANFSNAAPAAPTGVVVTAYQDFFQVVHNAIPTDAVGTVIHASTSSGFSIQPSNMVKKDVGTRHLVEAAATTTYYVRVGYYDEWSDSGLNYSAQFSVTTESLVSGLIPNAPTGLTVTSQLINNGNQTQIARLLIQWNRSSNASQYDLEIAESSGNTVILTVAQPDSGNISYYHDAQPGLTYTVRVRSRFSTGLSTWTGAVVHVAAAGIAPGVPTSVTATPAYQGAIIRWAFPGNPDFQSVEIYRTPAGGSETLVTRVNRPLTQYYDTGLTIGTNYTYRVRSLNIAGQTSAYVTATPNPVTAANVPNNTIAAAQIVAGSITALQIAANTITANNIAVGTITTDRIAANTITTNNLAVGNITGGFDRTGVARILRDQSAYIARGFAPNLRFQRTETVGGQIRTINANPEIYAVGSVSSGNVYIGGKFNQVANTGTTDLNWYARNSVAAYSQNGVVNTAFNLNLAGPGSESPVVFALLPLPDNTLLVGGLFISANGSSTNGLVRVNSSGGVLNTYTLNHSSLPGVGVCTALSRDSLGRIYVGGFFTTVNGTARTSIARLTSGYALDTTWNVNISGGNGNVYTCEVDPNNNDVLIGGDFDFVGGGSRVNAAIVNSSGQLTGFNAQVSRTLAQGVPYNRSEVRAFTVEHSTTYGKRYWLGGTFSYACGFSSGSFSRYLVLTNATGGYFRGLSPNGAVYAIKSGYYADGDDHMYFSGDFTLLDNVPVTLDGQWIGGGYPANNLARYRMDSLTAQEYRGFVDTNWSAGVGGITYAMAVDTQGGLLVGGNWRTVGGNINVKSITADHIRANSITASEIAADTITAAQIRTGSITVDKIASNIASDNYIAGQQGWAINRATGTAEFGNLNARGNLRTGNNTPGQQRFEILSNDSTYLVWAGTGAMTDPNAVFYIKRDGTAYVRGGISGGVLSTSVNTSSIAANAQITTGPFGTNGQPINVLVSYNYQSVVSSNELNWTSGTNPQATITLYAKTNGGPESTIRSETFFGSHFISNESEPCIPSFFRQHIGGSFTYVAPGLGTAGTREFRAQITSRILSSSTSTPRYCPGGSTAQASQEQTLSIVTTEVP